MSSILPLYTEVGCDKWIQIEGMLHHHHCVKKHWSDGWGSNVHQCWCGYEWKEPFLEPVLSPPPCQGQLVLEDEL